MAADEFASADNPVVIDRPHETGAVQHAPVAQIQRDEPCSSRTAYDLQSRRNASSPVNGQLTPPMRMTYSHGAGA
jgi:hypothetical protein